MKQEVQFRFFFTICLLSTMVFTPFVVSANAIASSPLSEVLEQISEQYEVVITYNSKLLSEINVDFAFKKGEELESAVNRALKLTNLKYRQLTGKYYVVFHETKTSKKTIKKIKQKFKEIEKLEKSENLNIRQISQVKKSHIIDVIEAAEKMVIVKSISGTVKDENGEPLVGATILAKGTSIGAATDLDGSYTLSVPDNTTTLVVSFIGYENIEIEIRGRSQIDITLSSSSSILDEVIVVGYGSVKKSDLTGSVVRADMDAFREQPNVSLMQSLQGSVTGLNVGQVDAAGEDPEILVRGRTSISGQQSPLVVLDGVIYRGALIDINPNDIESVDVLKDASATAVYGSQAANGVLLITSKSGKIDSKTIIRYNASYAMQSPGREILSGDGQNFIKTIIDGDITDSRIESSGFVDLDPSFDPTTRFKTGDMIAAFNDGKETNWYDLLTNDNPSIMSHNLSLSNRNEHTSTFASVGLTDQVGYHVGEDYKRWNARLNLDNYINDWLTVGIQTFMTTSDYSGLDINRDLRYLSPYALDRNDDGSLTVQPGGNSTNPLRNVQEADHDDRRLNLFGNIYAQIQIPWIEGLSYKINYATNYASATENIFRPFGQNFQGNGSKFNGTDRSYTSDNIVTYDRQITKDHKVTATLLYGFEKRNGASTLSSASVFLNDVLGFNQLQAGQSDLQNVETTAFEESSLYSMARLFYSFKGRYLLTGTVRRDGFSGFGAENKFGVFPSASAAWMISEEPFLVKNDALDLLKLRVAYGTSGNRTIGRYQTLARVEGGFSYVDAGGGPIFGQAITSLSNPGLKWETTTGINVGLDFGFRNSRIRGSIDYYRNDTKDLLYEVNLPQIAKFETIPVNLGKLKNSGLDLSITSDNIRTDNVRWTSTFNFSRNRDELVELLGFDNDNDGIEDDIIDASLFIGEPLNSIYGLETTGELYQLNEEIPSGFSLGSYKINDLNGDGDITPADRKLLGNENPNYRFSLMNEVQYGNFSLKVFLNSVQGGNGYYLGEDMLTSWNSINSENVFDRNFPLGVNYWTPENPDAKYQKPFINVASGVQGDRLSSRSFVRLQDVSLAYNLPQELVSKINLQSLKFYVSAKNLATWTSWSGWDPETGVGLTRSGRPVMKSITFGIDISL